MVEGLTAYCVRCRKSVKISNPVETKTKRGMKMLKGKCPVCKTNVCRMLGK